MEEVMEMDIILISQEGETTEVTEAILSATAAQETRETIIPKKGVKQTQAQEVTTKAWDQELVAKWAEEKDTIPAEQMEIIAVPEILTLTEAMEDQEDPVWAEGDSTDQEEGAMEETYHEAEDKV